jgi:predicted PurR-regulated permease PerM
VRSRVGGWPIAAALAVVAIVLYAVRYALLPFVFAAAIAFVADPLIRAGQRGLGVPRWVAAALTYIAVLAIFGAAVYAIGLNAIRDLVNLIENGPALTRNLVEQAVGSDGVVMFGKTYTAEEIMRRLGDATDHLLSPGVATAVGSFAVSGLFGVFLTLVLTPYFMISGPRLAAGSIWLIPPERRQSVLLLLPKIVPTLRRYLIGIVLVVAYTCAIAWIGFGPVFRLANAAVLAVTVGILEIIPVVGPLSSAALVGIVAAQQQSLQAAAFLVGFVIALRLSIDNLVGPLVLGQAARLHPVVIIAGFVCGAMLFGVVGLLLAVPTAMCIKIALEHYYAEPIRRDDEA